MTKTRTALITGASGGIGSAIALALAKAGYNIVVHYNENKKNALALVDEIKKYTNAIAIQANLEHLENAEKLYNEAVTYFNTIDTIVCACGIAHYDSFENLNEETYRRVTDINLGSQLLLISKALPRMRGKSYGRIVVISSIWGEVGGSWEVLYSSTKSALIGACKALSKEVAGDGITVNVVSPGVIDTAMLDKFSTDEKELLLKDVPAGRFGKPEDVASLVAFLCSDSAGYITGETISVGGGFGK